MASSFLLIDRVFIKQNSIALKPLCSFWFEHLILIRFYRFTPLRQQPVEPGVTLCNTAVGRDASLRLACDEIMTGIVLFIEGPGLSLNVRSPINSILNAAELLG